MHLSSVSIPTDDADQAELFYGSVLGLPARREDRHVVVTVGSTQLRLGPPSPGAVDHLAITVPADAFDDARRWLAERVALLSLDGQDQFEGAPSWDSRSVYFPGPSRCVLEIIARRRLPATGGGEPFGPQHLLCVSEVGVTVPDVPAAVARLRREAGLEVFGEGVGETFAAVGDDDGLVVLAAEGRAWFPTADLRATASPRSVVATGAPDSALRLGSTELFLAR